MTDGSILDRSGKPYKPSTTRGYERSLNLRVLPALGDRRLGDLRRREIQRFVDQMRADGLSASTIQNTLNPLQLICRRAVRDDELAVDPTDGLELPAIRGRRERSWRVSRPPRADESVAIRGGPGNARAVHAADAGDVGRGGRRHEQARATARGLMEDGARRSP
jgi:hypothetical protein